MFVRRANRFPCRTLRALQTAVCQPCCVDRSSAPPLCNHNCVIRSSQVASRPMIRRSLTRNVAGRPRRALDGTNSRVNRLRHVAKGPGNAGRNDSGRHQDHPRHMQRTPTSSESMRRDVVEYSGNESHCTRHVTARPGNRANDPPHAVCRPSNV